MVSRNTSSPLSVATALAAGTAAYGVAPAGAEAVRFEANGYGWLNTTLDITKSAADQPVGYNFMPTGNEIYLGYSDLAQGTQTVRERSLITSTDANTARAFQSDTGRLTSVGAGTLIGPDFDSSLWQDTAGYVYRAETLYYGGGSASFGTGFATDGSPQYIAVQLSINGATHYGWVSIAFTPRNVIYGEQFFGVDVLAWGYETEAGVPIAAGVPGPAPLGVLAIGAAGALGRRKRVA